MKGNAHLGFTPNDGGAHLGRVALIHRHRERLARQRRLIHVDSAVVDEAVRRDCTTGPQYHHVARHQLGRVHLLHLPVPLHVSTGLERGLKEQ